MRSMGLYWATFISLLFHIAFFSVSAVLIKRTAISIDTTTYMVNIVESLDSMAQPQAEPVPSELAQPETPSEPVSKSTMSYAAERLRSIKDQKMAQEHAVRRLRDMEARQRLKGIRESAALQADKESVAQGSEKATKILELYYAKVREKILRAWVYPDVGETKLLAVISITVMEDGRIVTNRIERTSGNSVFDRSALKAIGKASPVEAPPYGASLEIGVKFSPEDKMVFTQ